jgi:hypothetical protein
MGAVARLEHGWVFGSWGFDSLSFLLGDMAERKGSVLLRRRALPPACLR